jgi:RNA polymerase sigma-70 factor (ECF subfamily)
MVAVHDMVPASSWTDAYFDDLLVRAAQDDPAVFAELYRRHVDRVYRSLVGRLGDADLAQDLTAQTFLAALEGLRDYRGEGAFAAWLLRIARNKAMDHFRRTRRTVPLEAVVEMADPAPPPDDVAVRRLDLAQVAHAFHTLTVERAEAVGLRVFGGLSMAEVGRVMGKSEAAVKMLVQRGLRDLQAQLAVARNE